MESQMDAKNRSKLADHSYILKTNDQIPELAHNQLV